MVYARAGGLLAVPFDLKRLEVHGAAVPIVEGVGMDPVFGAAEFSPSATGQSLMSPECRAVAIAPLSGWIAEERPNRLQHHHVNTPRLGSRLTESGWLSRSKALTLESGSTIWRVAH